MLAVYFREPTCARSLTQIDRDSKVLNQKIGTEKICLICCQAKGPFLKILQSPQIRQMTQFLWLLSETKPLSLKKGNSQNSEE